MPQSFSFNVTIQAETQNEAATKIASAKNLANLLSPEDLALLVRVARDQPDKLQMAKKFL